MYIMKRRSVTKDIQRMVNGIGKEFRPERVILFGSHARGEGGVDSDVDLLIVMPVKGSKREKASEFGVALAWVKESRKGAAPMKRVNAPGHPPLDPLPSRAGKLITRCRNAC